MADTPVLLQLIQNFTLHHRQEQEAITLTNLEASFSFLEDLSIGIGNSKRSYTLKSMEGGSSKRNSRNLDSSILEKAIFE